MTSVVYPLLKPGIELRYSLRSLAKHGGASVGEVFVIGTDPKLPNVTHIPFTDRKGVRVCVNIWEKLLAIAGDDRISERFLYMNDDFYIKQDFDAAQVPNYCRPGGLQKYKDKEETSTRPYAHMLIASYDALARRGLGLLNFGTHQPMNLEKTKIRETFDEFRADIYGPRGMSFRCAYGNLHRLVPTRKGTAVLKKQHPAGLLPKQWAFASHSAIDLKDLDKLLRPLYPAKSRYEA